MHGSSGRGRSELADDVSHAPRHTRPHRYRQWRKESSSLIEGERLNTLFDMKNEK